MYASLFADPNPDQLTVDAKVRRAILPSMAGDSTCVGRGLACLKSSEQSARGAMLASSPGGRAKCIGSSSLGMLSPVATRLAAGFVTSLSQDPNRPGASICVR